jgi:hypothetical protein
MQNCKTININRSNISKNKMLSKTQATNDRSKYKPKWNYVRRYKFIQEDKLGQYKKKK